MPIKALVRRDGKLCPLLLFDFLNRVSGKEPKAASRSVSAMHALICIHESDFAVPVIHFALSYSSLLRQQERKPMAPAKRKANPAADAASTAPTKRQKKVVESTASSSRPSRTSLAAAAAPRSTRSSNVGKSTPAKPATKPTKATIEATVNGTGTKSATKTAKEVKTTDGRKRGKQAKTAKHGEEEAAEPEVTSTLVIDVPLREEPAAKAAAEEEVEASGEGPAYWYVFSESILLSFIVSPEICLRSISPFTNASMLAIPPPKSNTDYEFIIRLMKAEPESRIERGKDVKFSIDDLEAAKEPEGWDGM